MTVFVLEIVDILHMNFVQILQAIFLFYTVPENEQIHPKHCDIVLKWSYCTLYTFFKFSSHFLVGTWDMFFFSLAYR